MENGSLSTNHGVSTGNSKEIIYLEHFFNTLDKLQNNFNDIKTFNLYISYLESAVLKKDTRDKIRVEMFDEEKRLKSTEEYKNGNLDDTTIEFKLGFIVVREVMKYLNEVADLEHEDCTGEVGRVDDLSYLNDTKDDEDEEPEDYEPVGVGVEVD